MADRRKQQNFQAIPQYLTEEMWSSFSRQSQEKSRSMLLQHSWNLGTRCPSEGSFAIIYNILHLTSSPARTSDLTLWPVSRNSAGKEGVEKLQSGKATCGLLVCGVLGGASTGRAASSSGILFDCVSA